MTHIGSSSVEIDTWVRIGANTEICYQVLAAADDVEFTIGGRDGLELHMGEAALRNCVAAFTAALDVFDVAKQPSCT